MTQSDAVIVYAETAAPADTVSYRYTVQKPFRYGNRYYQQGEAFVPQGGRFDSLLLERHCTYEEVRS